ncbi:hypothetical protein, partial [Lactobacillus delbrueckii]|uniref:hypothetical protein n=1 Tax=Lactobacillus delbrueckii TaxID=1584 RepID=UPI0021A77014
LTPNLTAFTGVDSQNLPDVMVSVQFILAIGGRIFSFMRYRTERVNAQRYLSNQNVIFKAMFHFCSLDAIT